MTPVPSAPSDENVLHIAALTVKLDFLQTHIDSMQSIITDLQQSITSLQQSISNILQETKEAKTCVGNMQHCSEAGKKKIDAILKPLGGNASQ